MHVVLKLTALFVCVSTAFFCDVMGFAGHPGPDRTVPRSLTQCQPFLYYESLGHCNRQGRIESASGHLIPDNVIESGPGPGGLSQKLM